MDKDSVFVKICELLDAHHIPYDLWEHQKVRTSQDAAAVRGVSLHTGAKSMVIKAGDIFVLCILPANKQIDWKKVRSFLRVKSIRFATEEEAEHVARVQMGSVPPFGSLIGLESIYDPSLFDNESIYFNPGSVTHTIKMKSEDLKNLVHPTLLDITKS